MTSPTMWHASDLATPSWRCRPSRRPGQVATSRSESRGDYVVYFDAPAVLAPGALSALIDAHDQGCGVVSGAAANLTLSVTGWASFFDDPGQYSFVREPLLRLGGFDEHLTHTVGANARDRLERHGHQVADNLLVTFGHRTGRTTSRDYLRERLAFGRATARDSHQSLGSLPSLIGRDARRFAAIGKGSHDASSDAAEALRQVRPLLIAGLIAKWAGAGLEQLRSRSGGDQGVGARVAMRDLAGDGQPDSRQLASHQSTAEEGV